MNHLSTQQVEKNIVKFVMYLISIITIWESILFYILYLNFK